MKCSLRWTRDYPVLWIKIDKEGRQIPLASGSFLITRDPRFNVSYYSNDTGEPGPPSQQSSFTLHLNDIQLSDEGRYECQIVVQVSLSQQTDK